MSMMGPTGLELLADAPRPTGWSSGVFTFGLAIMLAGAVCSSFPLWKSASLSPDSIERRTFWTGTVVGLVLLFIACVPNWTMAFSLVGGLGFMLVFIAFFKSSHIKIKGRIYAADAHNREPDRPPALAKTDEDPY